MIEKREEKEKGCRTVNTTADRIDELYQKATKRALLFLPLYLAVPALFWLGFQAAGYEMDWKGFGLGALGWFIALLLRGPVSAMVIKLPQEKAKNIVGLSSGLLEESTRLALLAITSYSASWAVSAGQGWAAIEVVFTMVNVVVLASLANKTDEKSVQAKQFLAAQGTLNASPLWGIMERVWASAFHIGCTLIVASNPWTVVLLIPLHSALNWFAVRLVSRSIGMTSLLVAAVGAAALAIGLFLV
jgi:hypothetical protein